MANAVGKENPAITAFRATTAITGCFLVTYVYGSTTLALFATFSTVAMLMLTGFQGSAKTRLVSYVVGTVIGAVLVALATFASAFIWLAVVGTFAASIMIQTATVLGGAFARARFAMLLAWVLAVPVAAPADSWAPKSLGWLIGGVVSLAAALVPWPSNQPQGLRALVAHRARALAESLRAGPMPDSAIKLASGRIRCRPFGAWRSDHEIRCAAETLERALWFLELLPSAPSTEVAQLETVTARTLNRAADLAGARSDSMSVDEAAAFQRQRDSDLNQLTGSARDITGDSGRQPTDPPERNALVADLLSIDAALHAAASFRGSPPQPLVTGPPISSSDEGGALLRYLQLFASAIDPGSVWLHRSIRVAMGAALAVLITQLSDLSHGFWVALGTLSVLRFGAVATGRSFIQAMTGTLIGITASAGIVALQAHLPGDALLWAALPITIFVWGYAPGQLNAPAFVTGQGAFTLFLMVLFTLLAPEGMKVAETRILDVAIGGAVSVVVGWLLWPRGAQHRLQVESGNSVRAACAYFASSLRSGEDALKDRQTALRTQWRSYTALEDFEEVPETPTTNRVDWESALLLAQKIRLAGDMTWLGTWGASDGGSETTQLADAESRSLGEALLVAASFEHGRALVARTADVIAVNASAEMRTMDQADKDPTVPRVRWLLSWISFVDAAAWEATKGLPRI